MEKEATVDDVPPQSFQELEKFDGVLLFDA